MRRRLLELFVVATFLGVAFAQNTAYEQDSNWTAPPEAAAKHNPLASRPEAAAGGKKLFARNCVECHGEEGTGLAKKHSANLQLAVVQEQKDGVLYWKITNGNPDRGMPPFSQLPELQRWQLVLYIRSLKPMEKK